MTRRPSPPTARMFQAVGRLNRTRCALMSAVRETDTLPELRAAVLELASDIESFINGAEPASEIAESRRDTEPCPPPAQDECNGCDVCATLRLHGRRTPCRHCVAESSAPAVPVARPSGGP